MIRNIIFFLFFYLGIISISILFIPTLLIPKKGVQFGGRLMGIWTGICLKLFLDVNITVKGLENIPREKNTLLFALINLCLKHFIYKQFSIHLFLFLKKN